MKQLVLVPVLGQNLSRSCVQPRKDPAHQQCCACGRGNTKVNSMSCEERGKTVFTTGDGTELPEPHSSDISAFSEFYK